MKKILLFALLLGQFAYAQTFNFNASGDEEANKILKDYAQEENIFPAESISAYFCDIDGDEKSEILGIIKSNAFYSLAGYKLFILKKNSSFYEPVQSDIFFDETYPVEINNAKAVYHKTVFYKNKKYEAFYKNGEFKTAKNISDYLADRKISKIEAITAPKEAEYKAEFDLSDFKANPQKSLKLEYKDLSDKTKHYLDIK